MSRAIRIIMIASSFAAAVLAPRPAVAQGVTQMDGTGLIDYGQKPNFKVGTWAKYHVKGSNQEGETDEYTLTVLIAGEETFWGDECFWVESLKEDQRGPNAVATLVSYSIFEDPKAIPNLQRYLRKFLDELDESGKPVERVPRPPRTHPQRRSQSAGPAWSTDTLGTEEITVPRGTFLCRKIELKDVIGATVDKGDSSIRRDVTDKRTVYMSDRVPLTRLVREDMDNRSTIRTWKLGQSQGPGSHYEEVTTGTAVLVDFGEGMTPQLVPEARRKIRHGRFQSTGTGSGKRKRKSG